MIDLHLKIISFLKEIQPHFNELLVTDEGEYWETNDKTKLQNSLDSYFDAAKKSKADNPKLNGPYRLEDGRIIDLMEDN